ncbi:hypothetical protein ZEAMMB73_Zm00001d027794 [Zea mays]|uniref:Uncharacterized protein n=1 Tax=Zea mays TaxID=4577 RepID=A0A1D6JPN7_MAIZE|nr:hypothetical protein ZEAMMB73_Zm00001d027794 [Zea mays]
MQIFSRRKNEMLNILNKFTKKTQKIGMRAINILGIKAVRAIGLERTCGKPISDLASFRFPHCRHTRVQPATNAPAGDWSLDPVCFVGKLQAPLDGRRLEPRSSLLCWKTSSTTRRKCMAKKRVVCTEDQDTKIASFNKARLVRKVYFSEISKMKH